MVSDIDYLRFVFGFVCLLTGGSALRLQRVQGMHAAWRWLSLFAFLLGAREWFCTVALSFEILQSIASINRILLAGSLLCLLEFGVRLAPVRWIDRGRWLYTPLLLSASFGWLFDTSHFERAMLVGLLLPGGCFAAWAIKAHQRSVYPGVSALTVASISMGLFAMFFGGIAPMLSWYSIVSNAAHPIVPRAGVYAGLVSCLLLAMFGVHLWALYGQVYCLHIPEIKKYYTFHSLTRFSIVLILVLACGWALTNRFGVITQENLFSSKLLTTQTIAASLNPTDVAALSGAEHYQTSPLFVPLKQQLEAMHRITPLCRFTYLLGQRDGDIVFLVDAEPETSQNYSPPGQVYSEASPKLRSVFYHALPAVEGPLADRWGTWVSMFAPIRDHSSRNVVAVLGQDIDARTWQVLICRSRLVGICIALLVCVIVVGFFLVHQRTMEAAARIAASEEKYRVLVDGSPNTVMLLNADGRVVTVNKSGAALIGKRPEQIPGMRLHDIVQKTEHTTIDDALIKVCTGDAVRFEIKIARPDRSIVTCDALFNPIRDKGGDIRQIIGLFIDITQRKLAEQERERLIASLQEALGRVKLLSGLVPICAGCKKIRDDKGYWNQLETYLEEHSQAIFSHGLCPECMQKFYPEFVLEQGKDKSINENGNPAA
ncbi:MAG: PAS domain-containing protein [Desulfobacterota bacterium]|nr:PAS domain-containing protein [Thermodesulfobacteriota bacterium]